MRKSYYSNSENERYYKCIFGTVHVQTVTYLLCFTQLAFLCYSAISVPLAYAQVTHQTWTLVTVMFFATTFVSGLAAASTLLGIVGDRCQLLIPQILWLITCCVLAVIFINVAGAASMTGGWLAAMVFGTANTKWVIRDWSNMSDGGKIALGVAILIVVNTLTVYLSVWLVGAVLRCYKYIRAKVEFEHRMLYGKFAHDEQRPLNGEPRY